MGIHFLWLRGPDLNQRPSGYEPDELPNCSTPRYFVVHSLECLTIIYRHLAFVKSFLKYFLFLFYFILIHIFLFLKIVTMLIFYVRIIKLKQIHAKGDIL